MSACNWTKYYTEAFENNNNGAYIDLKLLYAMSYIGFKCV